MTHDLGAVDDFEQRRFRVLTVDGLEVGVLRWGEDFFVVRNVCPHETGPVCRGVVVPTLTSGSEGEPEADDETPTVVCPWHRWEFSLPSGAALRDKRQRLRTYRAWVESGRVHTELPSPRAAASA